MPRIVDSSSSYIHGREPPYTNSYIHPVILSLCRQYAPKRIIDLGCGNGFLCRDLANAGFDVVGVEPSRSGISAARELVPEGTFYEMGVYDSPDNIHETAFDMAVSTEVIEHLYRPSALPCLAANKLEEGGIFIVSTPYHGYLKNLAIASANRWDHHHSPTRNGGHIKFWSRRTLTALLTSCGFSVIAFHGAGRFSPFWKSMILVAQKNSAGV